MSKLTQKIINMYNMKERIDYKKEQLKELNKAYDKMRLEEIPNLMDDEGIEKVSVEGVGTLYLTSDVYASIPAPSRDGAFEWLRDHGYGDLVKETVNSSTLKAFVKGVFERGENLPEEMFKVTPFTRASIRKK